MYSDGITPSKGGWINKGNGEWDYLAEDGSRPSKWVASGANWYYVKDGRMLRNSWIASDSKGTKWYKVGDDGTMLTNTTDREGNVFNSYGVWIH
jgi:glucan-binding YG repeat protein